MRRFWRMVAVLGAMALVGAACGDDDGGGGSGSEDTGGASEASLEGVDIEVAAVWTGTEQERFTEVLNLFEEETGATVTFTSTGDDIAATLTPRISGGDPPDVAILPQPGLIGDFVEQEALQPLDELVGGVLDESFASFWRDLASVDDTLYGVPFKAANKSLVWYNVGVFDDAGVEAPEDLDGLLDVAQTATDFGVPAFSVAGADGWTLTDWFENVYLRTAGGDMYDQLANHEIPWTDESVTNALEVLADIFTDDLVAGGLDGALQTDFPTSVTQVFADDPAAAMVFEADFVGGVITGDAGAELGTDADVFPFPEIDGSGPAIIAGGDLAVLFTDSEGGRALIEFLASPAAGEVWAGLGGFISPNLEVDAGVYPDDITRSFAEGFTEAEDNARFDLSDLQPSEFGATVGQGLFQLFQDYLSDPSAVESVAEEMEAAAAAAYGE